jgi:hypothetical protein
LIQFLEAEPVLWCGLVCVSQVHHGRRVLASSLQRALLPLRGVTEDIYITVWTAATGNYYYADFCFSESPSPSAQTFNDGTSRALKMHGASLEVNITSGTRKGYGAETWNSPFILEVIEYNGRQETVLSRPVKEKEGHYIAGPVYSVTGISYSLAHPIPLCHYCSGPARSLFSL